MKVNTIIFYSPIEPLNNKANTAILTIDWYKKQFKFPISEEYFTNEYSFDTVLGQNYEIPNISDVVSHYSVYYHFQGKVEKRIFQYPENIVHILLSKLK